MTVHTEADIHFNSSLIYSTQSIQIQLLIENASVYSFLVLSGITTRLVILKIIRGICL